MIPIKIKIITFGRIGKEYFSLIDEYERRIQSMSHARFLRDEKIPPDAILLDQRGTELDSYEFYKILKKKGERGENIVFAVGPPEGFESVEGHTSISLSRLTFRHELAYLVLLEQVYRALLRMKGTKYER